MKERERERERGGKYIYMCVCFLKILMIVHDIKNIYEKINNIFFKF